MVVTKTHTDIWSLCASSGTLIAIPEHYLINSQISEGTNAQFTNWSTLLWWISLRAISSTTEFNLLQPPIWRHSRWVEVCDLLRQFCAWLPWPVLVWHILLVVGLYPDLHTGLAYSCLAGKYKHTLAYTQHAVNPWGRTKSLDLAGREVWVFCTGQLHQTTSWQAKGQCPLSSKMSNVAPKLMLSWS